MWLRAEFRSFEDSVCKPEHQSTPSASVDRNLEQPSRRRYAEGPKMPIASTQRDVEAMASHRDHEKSSCLHNWRRTCRSSSSACALETCWCAEVFPLTEGPSRLPESVPMLVHSTIMLSSSLCRGRLTVSMKETFVCPLLCCADKLSRC